MLFSNDFIWGAATASYQIEGAANIDGRGQSVWDMFCSKPDKIWDNHTGNVACDHYHRYKEDVALMKKIGLKAYRFSIAWPRVIPEGVGQINKKGLDFYSSLIDELIENDIEPMVTLFHWDLPLSLHNKGGWLNPDSPKWFEEYTKVIVDKLSDRVKYWLTFNEPQVFLQDGHRDGAHAPGLRLTLPELLLASHNILLSHGLSVKTIRSNSKTRSKIGWAPAGIIACPYNNTPEAIEAARKHTFSINKKDLWNSAWFMDPVYLGKYPEDGLKLYDKDLPKINDGDLELIAQPLDFCGANIYNACHIVDMQDDQITEISRKPNQALTAFGWPVDPESVYWGPKFFYERYNLPIHITENGLANTDWISSDGKVHDPQRTDFILRYTKEIARAIKDGIDIRGYFHWSLMDNFEWAQGYKYRFGLIYIDYENQKRILKDSAHFYSKIIKSNGKCLENPGTFENATKHPIKLQLPPKSNIQKAERQIAT